MLSLDWGVDAEVWSVTSFAELAREARQIERENRLHPLAKARTSYAPFTSLGTDGFGRSDTRTALRRFFEVDRHYVVVAALKALSDEAKIDKQTVNKAMQAFGIDPEKSNPVSV